MNYALIENEVVANIIWLSPTNASEFPTAIPMGERLVSIGDSYIDGVFLRDGVPVLTPLEQAEAELGEMADMIIDQAIEISMMKMEAGINA